MIAVLLSSLILFVIFLVFGIFINKIARLSLNFPDLIFLGLVATNTLVAYISLFYRIDYYVLLFLILGCTSLLLLFKKDLISILLSLSKTTFNYKLIIFFLILALIRASGAPDNYDTSLYHLQAIKWIEEYPVVPGLANLHSRFGFNSNVFLLYALTSFKNLFRQEIFSLNLIIFFVISSYILNNLNSVYEKNGISNLF